MMWHQIWWRQQNQHIWMKMLQIRWITPSVVRVIFTKKLLQEQPSYANGNILKNEENRQQSFNILTTPSYDVDNFDTKTNANKEDHHENVSRRTRSQSVQPISSEPLHGKANFQAKRFNTTVKSPRAERARSERAQSMTRSFPLTKSISTASNIGNNSNNENETAKNAEMHRLPTVLHIPDIKPR